MRSIGLQSRPRFGSAMKQSDMVFGYVILWVTAEEHLLRLGVDCEAGRTFSASIRYFFMSSGSAASANLIEPNFATYLISSFSLFRQKFRL